MKQKQKRRYVKPKDRTPMPKPTRVHRVMRDRLRADADHEEIQEFLATFREFVKELR
jgi:hypothetical protein